MHDNRYRIMTVGVINYGAGNLYSVVNMLNAVGADNRIVSAKRELNSVDALIIPGVGSFDNAVSNLHKAGMFNELKSAVQTLPTLGICLGMQILFDSSAEGELSGFGIIRGRVERLNAVGLVLPHIGWSTIDNARGILSGMNGEFFYFLHSYGVIDADCEAASCTYGEKFTAAVERDNIFACQFHPEKSGELGKSVITRFLNKAKGVSI